MNLIALLKEAYKVERSLTSHFACPLITTDTKFQVRSRLSLLLSLAQCNISLWPEVTQVSHRKVDTQAHLRGHHHESHVPSGSANGATSAKHRQPQWLLQELHSP